MVYRNILLWFKNSYILLCCINSVLFHETIYSHSWSAMVGFFQASTYLFTYLLHFICFSSITAVFAQSPEQARVTAVSPCSLFTLFCSLEVLYRGITYLMCLKKVNNCKQKNLRNYAQPSLEINCTSSLTQVQLNSKCSILLTGGQKSGC